MDCPTCNHPGMSCNRMPLPSPSEVPPTPSLRGLLSELLRFAVEFDGLDPATYPAAEFVQWLGLSVSVKPHPEQVDTRQSGQYERWKRAA